VPIIFIDSSILLNLSSEPHYDLFQLVSLLIKNKKIIAIEGAQRDEILIGKDKKGIDTLDNICCATRAFDIIQTKQLWRAILAYMKDDLDSFNLVWDDIFLQDPSISGTSGIGRAAISLEEREHLKQNLLNQAELHEIIRQAHNESCIDFKKTRIRVYEIIVNTWKNNPFFYEGNILRQEKYNHFWNSEFFNKIPYIYLFSSIYAKLVTNDKRQIFNNITNKPNEGKQGDWIDLISISTLLPYCDFFITDKFMKEMLKQIAEQDDNYTYFKRVYNSSKKDIEQLITDLNHINNKSLGSGHSPPDPLCPSPK